MQEKVWRDSGRRNRQWSRRQEEQAAELNFQLQVRVHELMEKLNKYSAPNLNIGELDEGPGEIQLEMFATQQESASAARRLEQHLCQTQQWAI